MWRWHLKCRSTEQYIEVASLNGIWRFRLLQCRAWHWSKIISWDTDILSQHRELHWSSIFNCDTDILIDTAQSNTLNQHHQMGHWHLDCRSTEQYIEPPSLNGTLASWLSQHRTWHWSKIISWDTDILSQHRELHWSSIFNCDNDILIDAAKSNTLNQHHQMGHWHLDWRSKEQYIEPASLNGTLASRLSQHGAIHWTSIIKWDTGILIDAAKSNTLNQHH